MDKFWSEKLTWVTIGKDVQVSIRILHMVAIYNQCGGIQKWNRTLGYFIDIYM